jgi:carboxyl-terminal processing protease
VSKQRKENMMSLSETVRRKERDAQETRSKLREQRLLAVSANSDLVVILDPKDARSKAMEEKSTARQIARMKGTMRADDGLQGDERALSAELDAEKAAKNAKDVLLHESVRILADEVALLKTDTRLASRVLPYVPEVPPAK